MGCHACRMACQNRNDLLADESFIRFFDLETGIVPAVAGETAPTQCMQCDDAPCAAVCPTGATHVNDKGIVAVDDTRCIGCKYCMAACPYHARVVNSQTGVVDKCRLCVAYAEEGSHPVNCVSACPGKVRIFGDLDDPASEVSRAIVETNAQPLAKNLSNAKFFYVR